MDILSLYLDGSKLEIAKVKRKKTSFIIELLHFEPFPIKNVKQLYKAIENPQKCRVVSGISCDKVLIKPLNIKASNIKILKKILPFQVVSLSHLKEEDSIYVPIFSGKEKKSFNLTCLLTSKHFISDIVQNMKKYKFDLDILSAVPMALVRFAHCFFSNLSSAYIIHIGRLESCFVYMSKNIPIAAYSIPIGSDDIEASLKETTINLSYIDDSKTDTLTLTLKKWKTEFTKAFSSLPKEHQQYPLLVTGHYDFFTQFQSYFFKDYSDYISEVLQDPEEENYSHFKKHAISIGLAIDALSKDNRHVQFLQKEFTPQKVYKKLIRKLFTFSFLFLSCLTSIFIALKTFENKKLKLLDKKLQSYITQDEGLLGRSIVFKKQDLQEKMDQWEKELKREASPFSYIVTTSNVHEALDWFFEHPLVKKGEIFLTNFVYELVSYPKLKEGKDPYRVQVVYEIQANNSSSARQFYNSLTDEPTFIDPNYEITWEEKETKYKTSFVLRRKQG